MLLNTQRMSLDLICFLLRILMKAMVDLNPRSFFLLQFIDKTYGEHFKKQDFKDEKAMIDYILDKENQKGRESLLQEVGAINVA